MTDRLSLSCRFKISAVIEFRSSEADKRQFVTVTSRDDQDKRRVLPSQSKSLATDEEKVQADILTFSSACIEIEIRGYLLRIVYVMILLLVLTSCLYKFITYTHSTHHTALLLPLPPSHTFLSIKADLINSCRQQGHCNS